MDENTLVNMRKKAETVGSEHRQFQAAVAKERSEAAAFLDTLRLAVKPGLAAIVSPIAWAPEHRGLLLLENPNGQLFLLDSETDEDGAAVFATVVSSRGSFVVSFPILSEEVVGRWRVKGVRKIVMALWKALDAQLCGRKAEKTEASLQLGAKFEALGTLLKG